MRVSVQIEKIDELRRGNGIGDIELHGEIDRLRVGEHVLLTFLSATNLRTTLPVRITRIRARDDSVAASPPGLRNRNCSVCEPMPWWPSPQTRSIPSLGNNLTVNETKPREDRGGGRGGYGGGRRERY